MSSLFSSQTARWLQAQPEDEAGRYKMTFAVHHLGNIFIRSLHGGVTGAMIEMSAEAETRKHVGEDIDLVIASTSIDYLRVTKDEDLHCRASIVRKSRRLSVVDVLCWQDNEDIPIARGVVTIRLFSAAEDQ